MSLDALSRAAQIDPIITFRSLDLGLALWDEAAAVIESRAPRVHDSDYPEYPYSAPDRDTGAAVQGDLDDAFATAALAEVAHAGREAKRRSMIATRALVSLRPESAALAMARRWNMRLIQRH
ncbi:hypothetical protein GCM10020367_65000 [Streptomyces sannanensis]|uniref:Uncharacterized protein n=2 Tax=Streptomyces sannanensis TaxID=285536 RepID=A0ABP6S486_9ACTN